MLVVVTPSWARILATLMAVLFLAAATVQYNDPDALLWMGIYGAAALLSALFVVDRFPRLAGLLFGASCLLWSLLRAQEVLGQHSLIGSEPGHEMLGLLIVAFWVGGLTLYKHKVHLP